MTKQLLFIDDDPYISDLYMRALTLDGFKVQYCADACDGLRVIRDTKQEFAAIILDLSMLPIDELPTNKIFHGLGTGVLL